jgi:hypothetical protein
MTMGISNKLHFPFMGRNSGSTEGDISQPEKQAYHNAPPIPRVTIHSFIMGVFVSMGGKLSVCLSGVAINVS